MLTKNSLGEFFENEDVYIFFGNKNFSNTRKTFDTNKFLFGKQTHEAELININHIHNTHSSTLIDSSDGLLTTSINKKIAIYTADCVPCFIYDGRSLFSLHLGWRSLHLGLLDEALSSLNGKAFLFIGPHIQYKSFEVGADVIKSFEETLSFSKDLWSKPLGNKKYSVSLKKIIELKASFFDHELIFSKVDTFTCNSHHSYRADKATDLRNISFAFLKK